MTMNDNRHIASDLEKYGNFRRNESFMQKQKVEPDGLYDEINYVRSRRKNGKTKKKFYLLRCFRHHRREDRCFADEEELNNAINESSDNFTVANGNAYDDIIYRGLLPLKAPPRIGHKEHDKSTQVPEVHVTAIESEDVEGSIHLSLKNPATETELYLAFKQNQTRIGELFQRRGLVLQEIERGSISFKFKIQCDDLKIDDVLSKKKLTTLLKEIFHETLNVSQSTFREDITIEIELSTLDKKTYNINASAVQIGDHNDTAISRAGDDDNGMYINPVPTDIPADLTKVTGCSPQVDAIPVLIDSKHGIMEQQKLPDPCVGNTMDSAYGSGTGNIAEQSVHDAAIVFRVSDCDQLRTVTDEVSALSSISNLEFDTQIDEIDLEVKMIILTRCIIFKNFYEQVLKFLTYPHLLKILVSDANMVTLEMRSDCELYSAVPPQEDGFICFQAQRKDDLKAITNELDHMKLLPLAAMKYTTDYDEGNNRIVMNITRSCESGREFLEHVLHFPTFHHLMEAIVDNRIDLSLGVKLTGNETDLQPGIPCLIETRDEITSQFSLKKKRSGLSGMLSKVRHSIRRPKKLMDDSLQTGAS